MTFSIGDRVTTIRLTETPFGTQFQPGTTGVVVCTDCEHPSGKRYIEVQFDGLYYDYETIGHWIPVDDLGSRPPPDFVPIPIPIVVEKVCTCTYIITLPSGHTETMNITDATQLAIRLSDLLT